MADRGVHELEVDIPNDGRSDGQEDKLPKGDDFKVVVIRARRGLDPSKGEEILDERTRVSHVDIDAFGETPWDMDEELLHRTEDSARLAGGHMVDTIHKFDLSENGFVFGGEEEVVQGNSGAGLGGHHGVHVGRVAEVDGGRATCGGVEAVEHFR